MAPALVPNFFATAEHPLLEVPLEVSPRAAELPSGDYEPVSAFRCRREALERPHWAPSRSPLRMNEGRLIAYANRKAAVPLSTTIRR